ncbi:MAG: hypothetical protein AB1627_11150 [Chloroflexota bacterium]
MTALVAMTAVVLAWPVPSHPRHSLDLSWQIGLHQAAQDGLRFGTDILYTYGPLGFLAKPAPFLGSTSTIAFVGVVAVYLSLMVMLLAGARRLMPLWVAVIATFVLARTITYIPPYEALQFVLFAVGVDLLRRDRVANPMRVAVVAGVLVAVAFMGKVNVGVFVAAGAGLVILAISPRPFRGLLAYAASLGAAGLALWLVTGQRLDDLAPYVRASLELISGYSEAMGMDKPGQRLAIAAFVVISGLVAWAAYRTSAGWPRWRLVALAGLTALLLFALWKHGFVRSHFAATFATLGLTLLVLMPRATSWWLKLGILAVAAAGLVGTSPITPLGYFNAPRSAIAFAGQARDSLLPWRWEVALDRTRRDLRRTFAIPPGILEQLAGRTVHIDPYAAAVATAYPTFTWRPLPVFQSYSAYTPYLDEVNAALLRSVERPELILRWYQTRTDAHRTAIFAVDFRNYWFESPVATLERLCRYRETAAMGVWQVLADTGRACGEATPIGTATARRGETVQVPDAPSPDQFVLVRIRGLDDGPTGRLRTLLWKSPERFVTLDGEEFRLVPRTADSGLVLAVPAAAQGSEPFAYGPPVRTITVREEGSDNGDNAGRGGELSYEFFAVPLQGS